MTAASTTLVGVGALSLVAAFGGYTASFACLVLERRSIGRTARGRSACVCGTPIPMWRNIPVVTWCAQRGRAACCGARIPSWYVISEAGTALAAVAGTLVVRGAPLLGALTGTLVAISLTVVAIRLQSVTAPTGDGDQRGH